MAGAQDRSTYDPFVYWFLGFWRDVADADAARRTELCNPIPIPDSDPFTKISNLAKSRLNEEQLKRIAALLYVSAACEDLRESRRQDRRAEAYLFRALRALEVRARREIQCLKEAFECNPERVDMHRQALLALADERAATYLRAAKLATPQESPYVCGVHWVFDQLGHKLGRKDLERIFEHAKEERRAAQICSQLRAYFYSSLPSTRKVFKRHPRLLVHRYHALPIDLAYFNIVCYLRLVCGLAKMDAYLLAGEIIEAYWHNWGRGQLKRFGHIAEVRFKRFLKRYRAYLPANFPS